MSEEELLELWNAKRSQIINAQIAPTLMLIAVFVLAAFGKFENATDATQYLTIGVAAATGILSIISQYAAIRVLIALLVAYERPARSKKKITGRGGDFE